MRTLTKPDFPSLFAKLKPTLPPEGNYRMFAIAFDLDTEMLRTLYPNPSHNNAYSEIKKILLEEGFDWQQGSVYFGKPERINMVRCVLAARRLARELPWFMGSVRDIRMLRIEDTNDLMPALEEAIQK
jgi:virulence-associated protein VapD